MVWKGRGGGEGGRWYRGDPGVFMSNGVDTQKNGTKKGRDLGS